MMVRVCIYSKSMKRIVLLEVSFLSVVDGAPISPVTPLPPRLICAEICFDQDRRFRGGRLHVLTSLLGIIVTPDADVPQEHVGKLQGAAS